MYIIFSLSDSSTTRREDHSTRRKEIHTLAVLLESILPPPKKKVFSKYKTKKMSSNENSENHINADKNSVTAKPTARVTCYSPLASLPPKENTHVPIIAPILKTNALCDQQNIQLTNDIKLSAHAQSVTAAITTDVKTQSIILATQSFQPQPQQPQQQQQQPHQQKPQQQHQQPLLQQQQPQQQRTKQKGKLKRFRRYFSKHFLTCVRPS